MRKFFRRVWIVFKCAFIDTLSAGWQAVIFFGSGPFFAIIVPLFLLIMIPFAEPESVTTTTKDLLDDVAGFTVFGWIYTLILLIIYVCGCHDIIKDEFKADEAARYAASPEGQEQARREAEERRRKEAEAYFYSLETYPFEFDHKHRMEKQSRGLSVFNRRANSLTCEFFEYCKTRYQNDEQQRQKAELEAELEKEKEKESGAEKEKMGSKQSIQVELPTESIYWGLMSDGKILKLDTVAKAKCYIDLITHEVKDGVETGRLCISLITENATGNYVMLKNVIVPSEHAETFDTIFEQGVTTTLSFKYHISEITNNLELVIEDATEPLWEEEPGAITIEEIKSFKMK